MGKARAVLGIDLGTSGVKVALADPTGELLALARRTYPLQLDGRRGRAEQDPRQWREACFAAIREVLARARTEVQAVAAGGQGPTFVTVDAQLEPTGPAWIWMDQRTEREAPEGSESEPASLLSRALWLKAHEPERYRRSSAVLQAWDFLVASLVGEPLLSHPLRRREWERAGLDPAKLPRFVPLGEVAGRLSAQAARATGLPRGIPVVSGTNDGFLAFIGSACLQAGRACAVAGTTVGFGCVVPGEPFLPRFLPLPAGLTIVGGASSAGGRTLDWLLGVLGQGQRDYDRALSRAAEVGPGTGGLLFLPYLSGERAPLRDPYARGVFFGLTLEHGAAHLLRSCLEAVAFCLRHLAEKVEEDGYEYGEVRCVGGQAASRLWSQIKADALDRPLLIPRVREAGVMGAAILAGVGAGWFASLEEGAEALVRPGGEVHPDPQAAAVYREAYGRWRQLHARLEDLFPRPAAAGQRAGLGLSR